MSQFNWPHPAYAEDQPYAKSLLYVHVFHRGYQVGAGIGLLSAVYRNIRGPRKIVSPSSSTATAARQIFWSSIGKGSLIGGGVTMALLTARMWGLEDIEWKDRSWRLLENKGQVMHDRYCDWGVGLGTLSAVAFRTSTGRIIAWETAGRAGLGGLLGAIACEVVRAWDKY